MMTPIVMTLTLTCVLVLLTANVTTGYTYNDSNTLMTDMLSGYNRKLRPVQNSTTTITISIAAALFHLLEVDTVKGTLSVKMSLFCYWDDEIITWTPSQYNDVSTIRMEQIDVWVPPLVIASEAKNIDIASSTDTVTYQSSGLARWSPSGIYDIVCSLNLKHWPYDKQICQLEIYVSETAGSEVNISMRGDKVIFNYLFPNGEWNIEDSSTRLSHTHSTPVAIFTIKLRRYSSFYFMTICIPLLAICLLNSLVFLLPSESGERVSYSVTMLLSMTVFLTVVSDSLPKVADPVPLICNILATTLVFSAVTVLLVILNLMIYHRDDSVNISPWYKICAAMCKTRKNKANNISASSTHNDDYIASTVYESTIASRDKKTEAECNETADQLTWKDVSYAIDRLLFTFMTLCSVVSALVFVIYLPTASEYQESYSPL